MGFRLVKVDALAGRSGTWGDRHFRLGVHDAGNISADDQGKLVPLFERFYGATSERNARAEHGALFAEGGPYHGDHPVLGPSDVRREGIEPAQGPAAPGVGDAQAAPVPERGAPAAGGGHERAEAHWGNPAPHLGAEQEVDPERDPGRVADDIAEDGSIVPAERHPDLVADEIEEDGSISVAPQPEPEPAEQATEPESAQEPAVVAQEPDLEQTDIDLAEAVAQLMPDVDDHWTPQGLPSLQALQGIVGRKVVRREVDAVCRGYNRTGARAAKE